jgi:hypothetical protein
MLLTWGAAHFLTSSRAALDGNPRCRAAAVCELIKNERSNMISAKASFLTGTVLLFAIVVASLAALGVGSLVSGAGFSGGWVRLAVCLTWGGVLIAIFTADRRWRMKNDR